MTITVDAGDGRIIEFPDEKSANQFFASQSPGQTTGQPLRATDDLLPPRQQSVGDVLLENIVGRGEIDTPGERLGATIKDVGSEFGKGVGRGLTGLVTLPQTLGGLLDAGVERVTGVPMQSALPDAAALATRATDDVFPRAPQTTAGRLAGTAGEFVPGAVAFGGASPANALRFGVLPGAASEAAGIATEGTAAEPFARAGAAIAAPTVLQAGSNIARRLVSPAGGANPTRLAAAKVLEREGVRATAGQVTDVEEQLFREAATKAGRAIEAEQGTQFTRAVLRRIGVSADRASPEVMAKAADDIGGVFESVAKGVDVAPSPDLVNKFAATLREYSQLAPRSGQAPLVGEISKKIVQAFRAGRDLSSRQVLAWRSSLGKLTRSADQATREAAVSGLNALDDALAGSLTAAGRADDVAKLSVARSQYRNLLAVENALVRAGSDAASGIITPANLRTAVAAQGKRAFAQGKGDLNELARAGVMIMRPLPDSGTAPRTLARELFAAGSSGTAVGLGSVGLGADPAIATMLGAGAIAAPRARNAFLASPVGQAYMRNQVAGPGRSILDQRLLGTLGGLLSQN